MNGWMPAEDMRVGWYGKLPAGGDFMHRNLEREPIQWWDRWLQRGVAGMGRSARDAEAAYLRAPCWNFVLPGGLGTQVVQLGCIGPSRDRVGRCFPLVLLACVPAERYRPELLSNSADFYRALGAGMQGVLRHGRNAAQLDESLRAATHAIDRPAEPGEIQRSNGAADDILSVLNGGHDIAPLSVPVDDGGWFELPLYFDEHADASYWWTNSVEGAAHKRHVHGGMLNSALFDRLFLNPVGLRG